MPKLKLGVFAGVVLLISSLSFASDRANPQFGYTHMQASPFTLPGGRVVLGTQSAIGITDFFQIGTDVYRDYLGYLNVNAKVAFVDREEFAFALTGDFEHYNLEDIHSSNPDVQVTSWHPGLVVSAALMDTLALTTGFQLNITEQDVGAAEDAGLETSGLTQGARVGADLSWAYNPRTKRGTVGNVLAAGLTYDFTYSLVGVGLSHYWPGFKLGFHFYPSADENRLQPILMGGAVIDL